MRKLVITILSLLTITSFSSCYADDIKRSEILPQQPENTNKENENHNLEENMNLKITIGTTTFTATLQDNVTVSAFKKSLPITITMSEFNNNEKYYELSERLPTNPSNPMTIQNGDIMLYGSRTLVLFYKNFPTPYSYTRLGKVNDTTNFVSALGSGDTTITFEIEEK